MNYSTELSPDSFTYPPIDTKFTSSKNVYMANWESSGWYVSIYYSPISVCGSIEPNSTKIENWNYAQVSDGKAKYICYTRDTLTGVITEKHINAFPLWYGN